VESHVRDQPGRTRPRRLAEAQGSEAHPPERDRQCQVDLPRVLRPPLTPLLPAPTLSPGEYKVSAGELKVSRQVGLPHNPRGGPR
jgi:hypothetical protein